ncbi:hypothetical protein DIURU_002529 [Diutina rugosa]|uniref:Uncharacterized protein n=1 Tax=Diutina rugosa TaxID=5481 RepID=A0A642UQ22_DIURU|nr:uncharacterized protein DIURU_002529 [Diutina rugosa]KAA8903242.1 hypothetical protein DIURU_002529 [Diutina rugosa]
MSAMVPMIAATDTTVKPASLPGLPIEVGRLIFSMADVASVCYLYIAYYPLPYAKEIASYLDSCKVRVSPAVVVIGNLSDVIDFDTLAKLPPCDIKVRCSRSDIDYTLGYLAHMAYKSVALDIDSFNIDMIPRHHPDFRCLGDRLTELRLLSSAVEQEYIPTSVQSLILSKCVCYDLLDLVHYTNLTEVNLDFTRFVAGVRLPPSVIDLRYYVKEDEPRLDVSNLVNLKIIDSYQVDNVRWSQIERSSEGDIPTGVTMEHLRELEVHNHASFRTNRLPKLEEVFVWSSDWAETVEELFTSAQLANLRDLNASNLMISNLGVLQNVTKLAFELRETLTETFPLPPNLVDLSIFSPNPVEGIPPQIKHFSYESQTHGRWERENYPFTSYVITKSKTLLSLSIEIASFVTIECPNLTNLYMMEFTAFNCIAAPKLKDLHYLSKLPFPFENGFDNLNEVMLFDVPSNMVFKQRMKQISLSSMVLKCLSISADEVSLSACVLPREFKIDATELSVRLMSISGQGITCKELRCEEIDQVPVMVEKVSLKLSKPMESSVDDESEVPELKGCTKLRSLTIEGGLQYYQDTFPVPSSVKQLGVTVWGRRGTLKFDTTNQLEFFKLMDEVDQDQVQFSLQPASIYMKKLDLGRHPPERP